jgi:GAF domain-containing protein
MTRPRVHDDPVTDLDRLAEICDLDLFSSRARSRLDEFARQAAARCDLPIGLVTVVLDGAQCFAGKHGLADWTTQTQGTPVEWSFCSTSVRTRQEYVVPDARIDPAQQDNPLVILDSICCYAGVPLITSRGHVVGNICVLGTEPRQFAAEELAELHRMATQIVAEMEASRLSAHTDNP